MQTSHIKQDALSNDPVWVLFTEISLLHFLPDHGRKDVATSGFFFQPVLELGVSSECLENITRTLAGAAREASARTKQGKLRLPGMVRIFCQKKIIGVPSSVNTSNLNREGQGKEPIQSNSASKADSPGGWGYFIIERGEHLLPSSSAIQRDSIDLYLYKEGADAGD